MNALNNHHSPSNQTKVTEPPDNESATILRSIAVVIAHSVSSMTSIFAGQFSINTLLTDWKDNFAQNEKFKQPSTRRNQNAIFFIIDKSRH